MGQREGAWYFQWLRRNSLKYMPLDRINSESAREKSIRHGHPDARAFMVGQAAPGSM